MRAFNGGQSKGRSRPLWAAPIHPRGYLRKVEAVEACISFQPFLSILGGECAAEGGNAPLSTSVKGDCCD